MNRLFVAIVYMLLVVLCCCSNAFAANARTAFVPGTIKAAFSVSLGGSSQYSVPLEVPSGVAGMAPVLLLNYDSNSGAGPLGIGWSIAGLSHISRATKTLKFDGQRAPVSLADTDALSLDNVRLIEIPSTNPHPILAKFIDDGNRIEDIPGPHGRYFVSRTKAGLRMYYGETADSQIKAPSGTVIYWACSKIVDTFGNEIDFSYTDNGSGDWGVSRIEYTKNTGAGQQPVASVEFTYHMAAHGAISFLSGEQLTKTLVLDQIRSTVNGNQFRRYTFSYDPQPETGRFGARRLRAVREFGTDDSARSPTTFDYSDADAHWQKVDTYTLPSEFGGEQSLLDGYRVLDLDGDGVPEIIYSANFIDAKTGALRPDRKTYKFNNGSWSLVPDLALPDALVTSSGADSGAEFVDVDGNGSVDFLVSSMSDVNGSATTAYRIAGGKWTVEPSFAFPVPLAINGKRSEIVQSIVIAAMRGLVTVDTRVTATPGRFTFWQFGGNGWTHQSIDVPAISGLGVSAKLLAADLDCNGRPDLVLADTSTGRVTAFRLSQNAGGQIEALSIFDKTFGQLRRIAAASVGACGHVIVQTMPGANSSIFDVSAGPGGVAQATPFDLGTAQASALIDFAVAKVRTGDDSVLLHLDRSSSVDAAVAVFDSSSKRWVRNPSYDYSPTAADDRTPDAWLTAVVDLDSNNVPDVLFLPTEAVQAPIVLLSTAGGGWTLGRQYAPDISFAQENKLGLEPQFVDLNGDHLTDAVGSNRDVSGVVSSIASINTGAGWVDDAQYNLPMPLTDEKSGRVGQLVDVDADGNVDFFYSYKGVHRLWRNTFSEVNGVRVPNHWQEDTTFPLPPEDMAEENAGDLGVRFVDVNGDGRMDILVARRDAQGSFYSRAYLNLASGFTETPEYRLPAPVVSRYQPDVSYVQAYSDFYRDLDVQFIDVNGDGLPDMVFRYRFQPNGMSTPDPKRNCLNRDKTKTLDGKNVVVLDPIPTGTTCGGVFLNTGTGWVAGDESYIPPIDMDASVHDASASISYVDINRDDLSDLLLVSASGNHTYLNTGKGWVADPAYDIPSVVANSAASASDFRLVDLDGDGSIDLAYSRVGASGAYTNTGFGWLPSATLAPPEPLVDASGTDLGFRVIDVDGNGLPDLIRSWKNAQGETTNSAFLNKGTRPDILTRVTNGLGLVASFSYAPITLSKADEDQTQAIYQSSGVSSYPIIEYVPSMFVVSELTVQEAADRIISTQYQYSNFRLDAETGVALGFEMRSARNEQSGIKEVATINQSLELGGTLKSESSSLNDVTLSSATYSYDVVQIAPTSFPERVDLLNTSSLTNDLSGARTGSSNITATHDAVGNVLSTCTTYGDGSWNLTSNTYDTSAKTTDPTTWFVGRLIGARSIKASSDVAAVCDSTASGPHAIASSAEFTYDGMTGVLLTETSNTNTGLPLQTTYRRDSFGNVVQTTTVDIRNRTRRSSSVRYDDSGRFVVRSVDGLGRDAGRAIDPVSGQVIQASDINGVSTQAFYDGFGRQITSTAPSGVISHDDVSWVSGIVVEGQTAVVVEAKVEGNLPPTRTYVDVQGRTIRTTVTADGGKLVNVDFVYDVFGRIIRQSLPYYQGDIPLWTNTEYDALARPTKETEPNGSTIVRTYSGLTVSTTDPLGRVTKEIRNLKGLVIASIDATGTATDFAYDADDRLVDTTEPGGRHIVNVYDDAGNRIETDDPDLGKWHYSYNGFGEVVSQLDARGQLATLEYDELGRVIEQVYPDQTTNWIYDAGPNATGSLTQLSRSDGYNERYQYDRFGRMVRREVMVADRSLSADIEYDDLGRPSRVFYPDGFATQNTYDAWGFLSTVETSDPDSPFGSWKVRWTSEVRDQYGRVTSELFGNGVRTKHTYDPKTGFQSGIKTLASNGRKLGDLSLKYDLVGNLIDKAEGATKRRETFFYDPLYRLTTWKVDGRTSGSYSFDAMGRLVSKSGTGKYHYDPSGPVHAVSSITLCSGECATTKFHYDADGNEILGPNGQFEYYGNNLVRLAFQNENRWSTFVYAADQSRVFESDRNGIDTVTTRSLGPFEEVEDSGLQFPAGLPKVTIDRLYLSGDTGVIAVLEHVVQHGPFLANSKFMKGDQSYNAIARMNVSAHYLMKDQLGSVVGVIDNSGHREVRYDYDPWGKRQVIFERTSNDRSIRKKTVDINRGFTGQQQIDVMNLIHMNGRIYDANLAQFVSADSTLQMPSNSQDYSRYSYVGNNPLRYTDPSGHGWLGDALGGLWHAVSSPFEKIGQWIGNNWKTVVIVVVAVVITVASEGTLGPVAAGMLAGAAAGGLGAALYGGNILEGALTGAVFGGLSAGFGSALGASVAGDYGEAAGLAAEAGGRGVISGMQSEYYGGGFWQGFATGAVTAAFSGYIHQLPGYMYRTVANFVLGGTAGVIGGGKFENAAITSAYSSLLGDSLVEAEQSGQGIGSGLLTFGNRLVDIATKVIAWPNSAIGVAWGMTNWALEGFASAGFPRFEHNALVFGNAPTMAGGAITFGNVIVIGSKESFETFAGNDYDDTLAHEEVHTYQSQVLGVGYLPANALGTALSAGSGGWAWGRGPLVGAGWMHGNLNFMEGAPWNNHLYGN